PTRRLEREVYLFPTHEAESGNYCVGSKSNKRTGQDPEDPLQVSTHHWRYNCGSRIPVLEHRYIRRRHYGRGRQCNAYTCCCVADLVVLNHQLGGLRRDASSAGIASKKTHCRKGCRRSLLRKF